MRTKIFQVEINSHCYRCMSYECVIGLETSTLKFNAPWELKGRDIKIEICPLSLQNHEGGNCTYLTLHSAICMNEIVYLWDKEWWSNSVEEGWLLHVYALSNSLHINKAPHRCLHATYVCWDQQINSFVHDGFAG